MVDKERMEDIEAFVPNSVALRGSAQGNLKGRKFVAKDLFSLKGHRNSFGHERWRLTHAASTTTSPILTRMLDAGVDLVGMTKLDQLAYSLVGNVGEGAYPRNAFDDRLFCGGSSSGTAAAVAAGLADIGLGTDTAGSIRVPAAACALHSIRPSHGLIEPAGVIPLAHSFDVVGIIGLHASLIAEAFRVLAPHACEPAPITEIKFAADVFGEAEVGIVAVGRAVAEAAATTLGASIREVEFGRFTNTEVGDLFARLQGREIWANHGLWVEQYGPLLAEDVRRRLERCERSYRDPEAVQGNDHAGWLAYKRSICDVVAPGSVVVLPVTLQRGPMRDWNEQQLVDFRSGCFRLAAPSSLSGAPQAVFSARHQGHLRSVGVGLLAAPGGDLSLLNLMFALGNDAAAADRSIG